ncbi:unnamed protein product [Gongylonema pulchrum]|uniref:Uncharacterized protein n=1 Tax=Gongylonema pulchrum TaxID=637853 RepID=A0A3P6RIY7_9BILA|nr:unnamed protein product [Gongylonema pulchrum]
MQEINSQKARIGRENSQLQQQIEETESQIANLSRLKTQHNQRLEDLQRAVEEETQRRQSLDSAVKNLVHQIEQLLENINIEQANKTELRKILSKKNAEVQQWQVRIDEAELVAVTHLDEVKQKQQAQIVQLHESLDATNSMIAASEKVKIRLSKDVEEARVEAGRHVVSAVHFEKKRAEMERTIEDWKQRENSLRREIEAARTDAKNSANDLFKLKGINEGLFEQVERLRRENKTLSQEVKDMKDQYDSGVQGLHETQKMVQRLSVEKEELQQALAEAEDGLEVEAAKVTRFQKDIEQTKSDIAKRFEEKDSEFETLRHNQQRAIESVQVKQFLSSD